MTWFRQNKSPLIQALVVFGLLFAAVVLLTLYYDFSDIDKGGLLFLAAFLCCLFIAKNTYDVARASVNSEELKQSVAAAGRPRSRSTSPRSTRRRKTKPRRSA